MVTDGQSTDLEATLQQATALHNTGITVVAVGVGDVINQTELVGIASSPRYVFTVSSFNALTTLEDTLERTACAATVPPPGEWYHRSLCATSRLSVTKRTLMLAFH